MEQLREEGPEAVPLLNKGLLACGAQLPKSAFTKAKSVCSYCLKRTREASAVNKLDKRRKANKQEEYERIQVYHQYTSVP